MTLAYAQAASEQPLPPQRAHELVLGATSQERARAYRRARRHTYFVRALRWLLPACALASLGLYAIPSRIRIEGIPGAPNIGVDSISLSTENMIMKRPRFDGYTPDKAYFEVSAETAVQNFALTANPKASSDDVALTGIKAKLTQPDESWVNMAAATGTMRIKAQTMRLTGGIDVTTSDTMRVRLDSADVDFTAKRLASDAAVSIDMPTGTVTATGLDVDASAKTLVFRSAVVARLNGNGTPPQPRSTPQAGGDAFSALQDQSGPIDIEAAQLIIHDGDKLAEFSGGVTARRPDSTLTGDTMRVAYLAGKNDQPTRPGAALTGGGAADIQQLEVIGNVELSASDGRTATAQQLIYDRQGNALSLVGNVAVGQGENVLRGGRVDIDIGKRHTVVSGPGRVIGRFEQTAAGAPGKNPAAAKAGPVPGLAAGDGPIDVEADRLDVFDERGLASFKGKVVAKRGAQQIKADQLELHYVAAAAGTGAPGADSRLKRMEARGNVAVKAPNNQTVTGQLMIYEAGTSIITVTGKVVVTGGSNVISGDKLEIDLRNGMTRFIDGGAVAGAVAGAQAAKPKKGRVSALITQGGFELADPTGPAASQSSAAPVERGPATKPQQKSTATKKPAAKPKLPDAELLP